MASNERSLGWTTGTSNDGATAYAAARMIAMELKTLGNGILSYGGDLAITYATNVLTIADGAALIGGYFYETTSASTISTATLNGTYTLALIANGSAGSYTVAQSAAGTTTVLVNTVRMALCTSAQLATIGAANYIVFATVGVGATGLITSVVPSYPFAVSRQLQGQTFAAMTSGSVTMSAANVDYTIANYTGTPYTGVDGAVTYNTTTGIVTVNFSGLYSIYAECNINSSTNYTQFGVVGANIMPVIQDNFYTNTFFRLSGMAYIDATSPVQIYAYARQGVSTSQNVTQAKLYVARV